MLRRYVLIQAAISTVSFLAMFAAYQQSLENTLSFQDKILTTIQGDPILAPAFFRTVLPRAQ